ncbi:MAG: ABC transporter permease subunit [Leptotrichiaceae bacterium]|nr:ABC transporter permease subunit [Leptotrichiaceae bacterium]
MKRIESESSIFRKRMRSRLIFILIIIILYKISSVVTGFEGGEFFLSVPEGIFWLLKNFIPTQNSMKYLPIILKTAFQTILLAVSATSVSAFFALIVAITGSETTGINKVTKILTKVTASFFRNMPVVAWSLILLFSFKQSEFTGFLALFFVTFGYLTRTFTETIDETAEHIVEGLKSTGASYFHIVFQGVIPTVAPQLVSWLLYYIESGIREATLIGILTGTGIGFIFNLYYKSIRYDASGLVILTVVIIVIGIELLSNKIRKEMM